MPLAGLIFSAANAAYQGIQADKQKDKADKLRQSNYLPPSLQQATSSAKADANRMSAGYGRAFDKIRQSTATTISNAKRSGGSSNQIQNAVAMADAREKESIKDLEVNENAYQLSMRRNLQGLQLNNGRYEQENQNAYNATKSALMGASMRNNYNAFTNLMEGAATALPDSAYGGAKKDSTTSAASVPTVGAGSAAAGLSIINNAGANAVKKKGLGKMAPTKKELDPNLMMDQNYYPDEFKLSKY